MAKTKYTEAQLHEISKLQSQYGVTRKSAIRRFERQQKEAARAAAKASKASDFKKAAAHDVEVPVVKLPAKNASAVAKGAAYSVLAGRPSKQAVIDAFGKAGYALSWVTRAERMQIAPEELCERFKDNPAQVKKDWAALASKSASAGAA